MKGKCFRLMIINGRMRRKHWLFYRFRREGYTAFGGYLYIGSDVFLLNDRSRT